MVAVVVVVAVYSCVKQCSPYSAAFDNSIHCRILIRETVSVQELRNRDHTLAKLTYSDLSLFPTEARHNLPVQKFLNCV